MTRMLAQEKNEIEVNIVLTFCTQLFLLFLLKIIYKYFFICFNIFCQYKVSLKEFDQIVKHEGRAHEILGLNWQYQLLFLGLYVWDVRLQHILQYIKDDSAFWDCSVHENTEGNELNNSEGIAVQDIQSVKDPGMERKQGTINSSNCYNSCGGVILDKAQLTDGHESPLCSDLDVRLSPASSGEVSVLFANDEQTPPSRVNELYHVVIPSDDTKKWVWNRFSQVEMEYKKELQCGSLDKFHLINKYTPLHSSLTHHKYQIDLGHFIVGPSGSILSVAEEEISSIIAHALTISEQQGFYSEAAFVKDEIVDGRKIDKLASSNMDRGASLLSSILFPSDSLEKNHNFIRNVSTLSSEASTSGFYDSFLSALKDLHPEICVNNEKVPLKSKYTIVCIYAKQFRDLRKICCPSELAYISSISRCKSWNAQGGKSKVFFAKSMDDRFIIKQIKKTEFDSFLRFGLEYFKHFGVSQVSSNPTCLAKILGIYQVCNKLSIS
jgi:1-phosphatidylinositol-3-phosphate 5-kinase